MATEPSNPSGKTSGSLVESVFVVAVTALMCLGALMVFSAGVTLEQDIQWYQFWRYTTLRQVVLVPVAWLILLLMGRLSYRKWLANSDGTPGVIIVLLQFIAVAALVLVLVPGIGTEVNGARRWIKIGAFTFQPSELAKWVTVLFLAVYAYWRGDKMRSFWRGFVPGAAVLLIVVALIGKEDFGTAALLGLVGTAILLIGGARWWHVLILVPLAAAAFYVLVYSNEYRWNRVLAYMRPTDQQQQATAYHAQQSLIAIGHAGLHGTGLGQGTMKMGFLPEDTTDFVFAVIAEELGFAGAVVIVALFGVLMLCAVLMICFSADRLARLVVVAVAATLGAQVLMNLMVVTSLAPTKGIALPFVSAGGSGLILTAMAAGVLVNIARNIPRQRNQTLAPADIQHGDAGCE
ncbi:MAG: cell division protein FtsW [Sedimentisphaerales bacterium]|nr:cell division protein FtsW [Sedimentisphaerales bacterium]